MANISTSDSNFLPWSIAGELAVDPVMAQVHHLLRQIMSYCCLLRAVSVVRLLASARQGDKGAAYCGRVGPHHCTLRSEVHALVDWLALLSPGNSASSLATGWER